MTFQPIGRARSSAESTENITTMPAPSRYRTLLKIGFFIVVSSYVFIALELTIYNPRFELVTPVDEHRLPARFPSPALLADTKGDFAGGLNKWFDDRFGLRDLFIRTKNQIDYSLFGTSRKVYVGKDGWLFERATIDGRLYLQQLPTHDFDRLQNAFLILAERLRRQGIHLIVVGYPDKSTLYQEFLPPQAPSIPPGGNYDKLRTFLSHQSALTFIDAEALLLREKAQTRDPLYFKTDIHPSYSGQISVVREIVDRIAHLEGKNGFRWNEKFDFREVDFGGGDESRFLATIWATQERALYTDDNDLIGKAEPDGHWNIPDLRAVSAVASGGGPPFDFEFHSLPQLCSQRLPGLAVFGNSFSDLWWGLRLHRYFCFIRRARTPIERLQAFVNTLPVGTKYFIFEYVSAYLPGEGPWLK